MGKSRATESPKAELHSFRLHKRIQRGIPVLVLILTLNKNPISKSLRNHSDLGNPGICCKCANLVSESQILTLPFLTLSPLVHPTNPSGCRLAMPKIRGMKKTQPSDHPHACGYAQPWGRVTTCLE